MRNPQSYVYKNWILEIPTLTNISKESCDYYGDNLINEEHRLKKPINIFIVFLFNLDILPEPRP